MKSDQMPTILQRAEHPLSRSLIDSDALWVMRKLRREGYMAYLVGGAVRDILLGREPKDFDIGTDATPSQLKALFNNSRTIGRRFRIVHVFFKRKGAPEKIIEVSTFRANRPHEAPGDLHPDDRDQSGSAFGTPEEDAFRRDFTVNALFYNVDDFTIIDYAGGLKDLEARTIRLINDPDVRFEEDPVRMLRAIEFSVRLGFSIAPATAEGMRRNAARITEASSARLREELRQMHQKAITGEVLRRAQEFGLLPYLFDSVVPDEATFKLLSHVDTSPAFSGVGAEYAYIAALATTGLNEVAPLTPSTSLEQAHDAVFPLVGTICERYQISSHIRHQARELILCCYRLARGKAYRAKGKFSRRAEFRGALEFYDAWVNALGVDPEALNYWRAYLNPTETEKPVAPAKRRRKRRSRRPRREAGAATPE